MAQIFGLCCLVVTHGEMSALGQKQTSEDIQSMSALPQKRTSAGRIGMSTLTRVCAKSRSSRILIKEQTDKDFIGSVARPDTRCRAATNLHPDECRASAGWVVL